MVLLGTSTWLEPESSPSNLVFSLFGPRDPPGKVFNHGLRETGIYAINDPVHRLWKTRDPWTLQW